MGNIMGGMFAWEEEVEEEEGGEKDQVPPHPDIAVNQSELLMAERLANTLAQLRLKQKKAEFDATQCTSKAKQAYDNANEPAARAWLQKKRQHLARAHQLQGQIANLEQTEMTLDSTATAKEIAQVMDSSVNVMAQQMQGLNVEDLYEIHNDLSEITAEAQEFSDALAAPIAMPGYEDGEQDDAIAREMAQWEDEKKIQQAEEIGETLPSVPQHNNNNNNNDDGSDSHRTSVKKDKQEV